jgi:hypothetical protein
VLGRPFSNGVPGVAGANPAVPTGAVLAGARIGVGLGVVLLPTALLRAPHDVVTMTT